MNSTAYLNLMDALRSTAFSSLALASSVFGLVYSGIALFNQSILQQRGFHATTYHTVLGISTIVGLGANFAGGWIGFRYSIQKLMGAGMAVLAASLILLPNVRTFEHVAAYAATMGLAGGVVTVLFFSVLGPSLRQSPLRSHSRICTNDDRARFGAGSFVTRRNPGKNRFQ
jgi:MFS family permease